MVEVARWVFYFMIIQGAPSMAGSSYSHSPPLNDDPVDSSRSRVRGAQITSHLSSSEAKQGDSIRSLVLGGKDTKQDRYSFAEVSLQLGIDDHQCGGTLIAPDIILTAAHCKNWVRTAHIDRHDFENDADEYQIFDLPSRILHPSFKAGTFEYDFMILPIETVAGAQPIRLNDNPNIPLVGDELAVLGWGAVDITTNPYKPEYATVLQLGTVEYIENKQCEETNVRGKSLYKDEIFPEMMCAANPGVDACSGDSGGPLVAIGDREGLDIQVGIVSWGRGCALYPGVYSRISSGYSWIRRQVCWFSRDPPSYMNCADDERNPEFTVVPQTPSPVDSPPDRSDQSGKSQTNVKEEEKSKLEDEGVGSTPTMSPVTSGSGVKENSLSGKEQKEEIDILVEIQLDGRSGETGWFLAENGHKVVDFPYETYGFTQNKIIRETVSVTAGSTILFAITDRSGDGICCGHGRNGWYRIFVSKGKGQTVEVVEADGAFGRRSSLQFTAEVGSAADGTLYLLGSAPEPVISEEESPALPYLLTAGLDEYARSSARKTFISSLLVLPLTLVLRWTP